MTRHRLLAAILLALVAGGADAACLVDYKAKKDDPLQLHYGIVQLDDAACADPDAAVAERIAVDGWTLLTVMGELSEEEAEERQRNAGAYFLRY